MPQRKYSVYRYDEHRHLVNFSDISMYRHQMTITFLTRIGKFTLLLIL